MVIFTRAERRGEAGTHTQAGAAIGAQVRPADHSATCRVSGKCGIRGRGGVEGGGRGVAPCPPPPTPAGPIQHGN